MVQQVLITGATGYIAGQLLPTFQQNYKTVLVDINDVNREGNNIEDVHIVDLIEPNLSNYSHLFEGIDAVIHLGYKRRTGNNPLDHFYDEKDNVAMAYNVLRAAYDAGVPRVVIASSNHAADWYEHNLIHQRQMEVLDPYKLPLSDNFYGWAKATYEHMGFLFACGRMGFNDSDGREDHTGSSQNNQRKMGVVMIRIGAPREVVLAHYNNNAANYKRDLGAYISSRDLTQLFVKATETPDITNKHGIPWLVVYGISNNTRAFWSLANARQVLNYKPEDDSEVKYSEDIYNFLVDDHKAGKQGRIGLV